MKDEYTIINKSVLEKRIEDWENKYGNEDNESSSEIYMLLKEILSQSIPLIPEIEKAFDAGFKTKQQGILMKRIEYTQQKQDYISNLKLDI